MATSWVLVVSIGLSALATVFSTCPTGWTEHARECFLFSPHTRSWSDAQADCQKHTSYLTTDDNRAKHNFLKLYLNIFHSWHLGHFWLGGSDNVIEGQWRWLESGTGIGSDTFWDQGQPDGNSSANCMSFYMNGNNSLVWRDDRCTHHHNYICEQAATGPSTTTVSIIG